MLWVALSKFSTGTKIWWCHLKVVATVHSPCLIHSRNLNHSLTWLALKPALLLHWDEASRDCQNPLRYNCQMPNPSCSIVDWSKSLPHFSRLQIWRHRRGLTCQMQHCVLRCFRLEKCLNHWRCIPVLLVTYVSGVPVQWPARSWKKFSLLA